MANFQLANPAQYIAHFYSAAVISGATGAEIRLGWWVSVLEFQGVEFRAEDLAEPFAHLLTSPRTPREWALQELAIALQSSAGAGVKKVKLAYPGLQSKELKSNIFLSEREGVSTLQVTLHHRRPLWAIVSMIFGRYWLPEHKHMRSGLFSPHSGAFKVEWVGWKFEIPLIEQKKTELLGSSPLQSMTIPNGKVAIGTDGELGKKKNSKLFLLIRGRLFQEPLPLGRGQVRAVLVGNDLSLDLSQSAPLKNEAYLQRVQQVARAVLTLQKKALLHNSELSKKAKRGLVREVARSLRSDAKLQECLELLQTRRYDDTRIASLFSVLGDLESAKASLQEEVERVEMPQGLLPSRLFNLAAIQAQNENYSCFDTWSRGHQLVVEQHRQRKGHLVGEALERKLLWLLDLREPGKEEEALWLEACELKKGLGSQHRRQARTLDIGAYLYLRTGDPSRAEDLARRSLKLRVSNEGSGNPSLGQPLTLLALAQLLKKDDAFRVTVKRRLSLTTTVYGEVHPEVAASHYLAALSKENEERQASIKLASKMLMELGLPVPPSHRALVCYRGWFLGRSPWDCVQPLMWSLNPPGFP